MFTDCAWTYIGASIRVDPASAVPIGYYPSRTCARLAGPEVTSIIYADTTHDRRRANRLRR
jgi:hypothetical protein